MRESLSSGPSRGALTAGGLRDTSCRLMAGKKAAPEVHKFGGASLGDADAFRHAVGIMQKRTAPRAIVVSALAGITDTLLGLANRATAGGDAHLGRDAQTLRTRYRAILDAVC